ncbi:glycerophosphodiester phosphodiesterase [Leucobacter zeae]|nr:glycerophosphodiester phosphodiesterase [Leucobacter zeae]
MIAPRHPYFASAGRPRILAHRGLVPPELVAAGIAENTRAALAAAVAAGAEYLETDCHLTGDGRVVLFHDADLVRVAGDPRAVADISYAELTRVLEGRGGALTLEDALAAFPDSRFNIDVKAAAVAEPLGRIVAPHGHRVLLTGFDDALRDRALATAADEIDAGNGTVLPAASPGQRGIVRALLASWSGSRRAAARALAGFDALQIPERHGPVRVLSRRLLDAAHANGVEVHVWTVNDPERMRRLVASGVDGIVTDRADVALAALRPQ